MPQNIEIEFKNMLTKTEYQTLLIAFKIKAEQFFTQENHYFDTPDFALKNMGSALRIRKKQKGFEMTLKQPVEIGLLETNQPLNAAEAEQMLQAGTLPAGEIKAKIDAISGDFSTLEYFGSLKTNRVEIAYQEGLLVLDHSLYLNTEDFEMEYEVQNYQKGKSIFDEILKLYQIPERKTKNKIQRFYETKYSQSRKTNGGI
ncbi:CYTH domain-containing protein [Bacillus sp. BRMEA1]|uniref:CYTH domain-containing protein n=1 Tax=Neobacillus endophyticus TaxID=2738405 RepID=UPI00156532AE|nr:CYTH domain-containing protein [Neobacillus endophyticus]NRD78444.1 CYTH domain-containing protein [Neobacillus endophyticus]